MRKEKILEYFEICEKKMTEKELRDFYEDLYYRVEYLTEKWLIDKKVSEKSK